MAVPAEIRAVPRPKNTVVSDTGRDGPKRYPVRERQGVKYVQGGNPQPRNGKIIGHIINFKFVQKQDKPASEGPNALSYGSSVLVHNAVGDLLDDLYTVMDAKDAQRVVAIACLRVIKPGITLSRYSTIYGMTFISYFYKNIGISSGVVEDLEKRLGQDANVRENFFNLRFSRVLATHKIAIDGTLKQDTSSINSLSAFSYKSRVKGCRNISVLYAYDIDTKEPICAQVFPGNSIDATSYREFIKTNKITRGIIIADKGFPPNKIADEFKENEDLHFITPIKNNDRRIAKYDMLTFEEIVKGVGKPVLCKKQKLPDGKFLYAFRDISLAGYEDVSYVERALKNNTFSTEKYTKAHTKMGVIVFESDQDLPAEDLYRCYSQRWELELVFRYYKSDIELDKTGVQSDFAVIGSEFINFVATVITCRIIEKMSKAGVLNKLSYKVVMDDLFSSARYVEHADNPKEGDRYWVHTMPKVMKTLIALGLAKSSKDAAQNSDPGTEEKEVNEDSKNADCIKDNEDNKDIDNEKTKEMLAKDDKQDSARQCEQLVAKSTDVECVPDKENTDMPVKRKRGRPRTKPPKDPNAPKRGRGRPRTRPVQEGPKRPVGRPRKDGTPPRSRTAPKEN